MTAAPVPPLEHSIAAARFWTQLDVQLPDEPHIGAPVTFTAQESLFATTVPIDLDDLTR